jgi:hypothetical protein
MWSHTCNFNYLGDKDRRIMVEAGPGKVSVRPYPNILSLCGFRIQINGKDGKNDYSILGPIPSKEVTDGQIRPFRKCKS